MLKLIIEMLEFQNLFGSYTNDSYIPFTVEEYLRSGQTITVTRLYYPTS